MSRSFPWLLILVLAATALVFGALGASHYWDERGSNILFFAAWCAAMLMLFMLGLRLPLRIPGSRSRARLFNAALAVGAVVTTCLANVAIFRHDVYLDVSREAANTPSPHLESVLDGMRSDVVGRAEERRLADLFLQPFGQERDRRERFADGRLTPEPVFPFPGHRYRQGARQGA